MTKIFSFITLLISLTNSVFCQVGNGKGVRVYIEKPNTNLYKQTIVAFTDASTDGIDQNDALVFGGTTYLFTELNNQAYTINAFGPLTEDKTVPLKTAISPDTGLFIIGIDTFMTYGESNEERLLVGLFDNSTNTLHNLETPYVFQGPTANRFSLVFEPPITVEIVNGCNLGYIVIDNDEPSSPYHLQSDEFVGFYSNETDTIFNLPNGNYTLSLPFEEFLEVSSFSVENTIIEASLSIPLTTVYLDESCIMPVLTINSLWHSIIWDFGDGNFFYNDINPLHYYSQSGTYILSVTISEGFCEKIFQTEIQVKEPLGLGVLEYKYLPKYKPSNFYYAIDGRLMKK
jgi:hypothetical protein